MKIEQFLDLNFLTRRFLLIYLIFLPFQELPKFLKIDESGFIKLISYTDELITIVMFFMVLLFILIRYSTFSVDLNILPSKPLFIFILTCIFSIAFNMVYILQGIFGTYNLIKNLIIIYFFTMLTWKRDDIDILIKGVIVIALLLSVLGIVGEFLALSGLESYGLVNINESRTRLGLFRAHSLVGRGATNYLAIYLILVFFLVDFIIKKIAVRKILKLIIFTMIFLTLSRIGMLGFLFMLFLQRIHVRKNITIYAGVFGLFLLMGLFYMVRTSTEFFVPELSSEDYYRGFTYLKSLELFISKPLIGVGPGMFGDVASIIFHSPYYSDWPDFFYNAFLGMGSLDSQWPYVAVQTGIIGLIAYLYIFEWIYKKISQYAKIYKIKDQRFYNLGRVLSNYVVVIVLMGFGSGLNKPFVVYLFMGLCGMYLSIAYRELSKGIQR